MAKFVSAVGSVSRRPSSSLIAVRSRILGECDEPVVGRVRLGHAPVEVDLLVRGGQSGQVELAPALHLHAFGDERVQAADEAVFGQARRRRPEREVVVHRRTGAGDGDRQTVHLVGEHPRTDDVLQRGGHLVEVVGLVLPADVDVGVDRRRDVDQLDETADRLIQAGEAGGSRYQGRAPALGGDVRTARGAARLEVGEVLVAVVATREHLQHHRRLSARVGQALAEQADEGFGAADHRRDPLVAVGSTRVLVEVVQLFADGGVLAVAVTQQPRLPVPGVQDASGQVGDRRDADLRR